MWSPSTASTWRRTRHGLRAAGPQRRRQDHRGAHPHHDPEPRRRHAPACSASTSTRTPRRVRERIGLAGQYAAVDENLTGRENLRLVGQLTHLSRKVDPRPRADELLERFGLTHAADRPARTYSGGMRRRLDLGAALVHRPPGAVPRRAHHRPRPGQPQRPLGRHPGAGGRRHHRAAHHAVPGGGRPPGRPHRRDRRRPQDRRGHVGRAQGHHGRHHRRDRHGHRRRRGDARPRACWPRSARSSRTTTGTSLEVNIGDGARGVLDVARILEQRRARARQRSPCASRRSTTCSSA